MSAAGHESPAPAESNPAFSAAEPWRAEYPIRRDQEALISRRNFGTMFCGACAVAAGATVLSRNLEAEPPHGAGAEFDAAATADLPFGASLPVMPPDGSAPVLLLRLPGGELRAYDQRCTHLLCPVHYDGERDLIVCPCHHGLFDSASGAPAGGPPRRALPRREVRETEGRILLGDWMKPEGK